MDNLLNCSLFFGQTRQQETSAGKNPEEPPKQSKNFQTFLEVATMLPQG